MTSEQRATGSGEFASSFHLRILKADDAAALSALHHTLDERDAHLRFFAPRPKDLDALALRLAAADLSHGAVGAFESGQLIGAANFIVLDDPEIAEIAMVVRHDRQLHGIGTALLARLVEIARDHGVRTFVAEVLLENITMLKVIAETGLPTVRSREGAALHLEIELGHLTDGDN